jgi:hypothetical protein
MKARHLAWSLWLVFVVVLAVATYYGLNPERDVKPITLVDAFWAWSFIGFPTTGALIASRFPERPLGWLFIAGPLLIMSAIFVSDPTGGVVPEAGKWLAWVANVTLSGGMATLMFIPFYLPSGSRERTLQIPYRIVVGCVVAWMLGATFAPGPLAEFAEFRNPVGIEALGPIFRFLKAALGPVLFACVLLGIGTIVLRYRRSEGQERLQMKWIALGASTVPLVFFGIFLTERLAGDLSDAQVTVPIILSILAIPISIAVAMLKHRLFEIDQIINRTLVYTLVTALLVGAYLGLVFALQLIMEPITPDSDLAIAGSTLAVAALFRPLRARIQAFIDRRFYRRKYDAARSLGQFATRLRDEIDLEVVHGEVLTVLHDTVQPSHVGLWFKQGAAR